MIPDSKSEGADLNLPFPGKIVIINNLPIHTQNDEEFWAGEQTMAKYGPGSIIHLNWPTYFIQEREQVEAIISTLSVNREVKALVINQAIPGCNAAIEKFKKIRDDVFIVYCIPQEDPRESAAIANLVLMPDRLRMGQTIIKQAKKQGAATFIHYSFKRHMAAELEAGCRDVMKETCAAEGIKFIDAGALDPQGNAGVYNAEMFILEDVPRMVAKYGENTSFYCTNCFLQVPLIKAVTDSHAIFSQPCCPSPFHGFPEALNIEKGEGIPDINYMISETRRIAAAKNMTGRLSTWPVPLPMMLTSISVDYAARWINGEVPKTGIDDKALLECLKTYIRECTGHDINVNLFPFTDGNKEYENFKFLLMDYLDY